MKPISKETGSAPEKKTKKQTVRRLIGAVLLGGSLAGCAEAPQEHPFYEQPMPSPSTEEAKHPFETEAEKVDTAIKEHETKRQKRFEVITLDAGDTVRGKLKELGFEGDELERAVEYFAFFNPDVDNPDQVQAGETYVFPIPGAFE